MILEEFATAAELAAMIGCCLRTAHRRLRAAGYKPQKNGRVTLYPVMALGDVRVVGPR